MFQKALGRIVFKSWFIIFLLACTPALSQQNSEIDSLSIQPITDTLAFNNPAISRESSNDLEYTNNIAAKVKQQNTLIIGIVMIMFLSIALAGTFYSQQRSQKQVNFLLAEKNQQINSQKEKIEAQAAKLKNLNKKLGQVNENLENQVKERTEKLLEQNQKLSEYAYTNAHELRAPVANVLGLVNLLSKSPLQEQEAEILSHLSKSAQELDDVIKNIRRKLEEEEGNSAS